MPVPPLPPFPERFFRLPMIRPKPLQRRILEYLSQGGRPGINAISTHLRVWRFSARRSLQAMKTRGFVKDRWALFAPDVVPKLIAHVFSITEQGRKQLPLMQSTEASTEPYPLGYRILLFMSHGGLMTVGRIAKMVDKDRGHVKRVIESLQNAGLVACHMNSTHTPSGYDAITHIYVISKLGREVLSSGPAAYLERTRKRLRMV